MGITVKKSGTPPKFDGAKAAKLIVGYVPGAILRRTDRGISSTGAPFAPYSESYRKKLAAGGESQAVDLRLTSGLLNSIKGRPTITPDDVSVVFAPDTGTSPQVSLGGGRARRTGNRSPPHNVLGYWIHHGIGMPARPFMGLTPDEERAMRDILVRAKLWG